MSVVDAFQKTLMDWIQTQAIRNGASENEIFTTLAADATLQGIWGHRAVTFADVKTAVSILKQKPENVRSVSMNREEKLRLFLSKAGEILKANPDIEIAEMARQMGVSKMTAAKYRKIVSGGGKAAPRKRKAAVPPPADQEISGDISLAGLEGLLKQVLEYVDKLREKQKAAAQALFL